MTAAELEDKYTLVSDQGMVEFVCVDDKFRLGYRKWVAQWGAVSTPHKHQGAYGSMLDVDEFRAFEQRRKNCRFWNRGIRRPDSEWRRRRRRPKMSFLEELGTDRTIGIGKWPIQVYGKVNLSRSIGPAPCLSKLRMPCNNSLYMELRRIGQI